MGVRGPHLDSLENCVERNTHLHTYLQIFKEIEERLQFQQDMAAVKGAHQSCQAVRIEVAQRVSELARLGVDVSAARMSNCEGKEPCQRERVPSYCPIHDVGLVTSLPS